MWVYAHTHTYLDFATYMHACMHACIQTQTNACFHRALAYMSIFHYVGVSLTGIVLAPTQRGPAIVQVGLVAAIAQGPCRERQVVW